MRFIDADALPRHGQRKGIIYSRDIDNAPTIDAVPVVRCKDCKHCEYASNRVPTERAWVCYKCLCDVEQDWFCSFGERKDDEID